MEVITDKQRIAWLAENVRRRMKKSGLSQTALSEATGIPQTSISRVLRQENDPTVSLVCRLADFFETSVDLLLSAPKPEPAKRNLAIAS